MAKGNENLEVLGFQVQGKRVCFVVGMKEEKEFVVVQGCVTVCQRIRRGKKNNTLGTLVSKLSFNIPLSCFNAFSTMKHIIWTH